MAQANHVGAFGQKETPAEGRGFKNASRECVSLFPPREEFFPHKNYVARTTRTIKVTGSESRLTLSVLPLISVMAWIKFGL